MSTNNFQAIVAQFQFISDNYSEQPAILFKNQSISYQTFKHQVNQFSNYLTSISAHESGYIGICLPRSPELMVAIMSAINLGIKYIPFDIEYPQERLGHMATVSGVKNIITLSGLKNQLPDGNFKPINFDEINFDAIDSNFTPISNVNDAGYVLFTSGSTGLPKGVEMSHAALCNLINWQVKESKMQVGHKTLQFAPVSFDVHFQEIFSTWCVGGCICLIEDTERLNVNELKNYLVTNRINRLFLPFIALQTFCDFVKDSSSTFNDLLEIVTAGEQLQITPAIRSFFEKNSQCKLFNHYGPTETHVVTSYQLPNNVQEWPLLPPIGNAISNVHCFLLDENGNRVNKGMSGELYVSGLCLSDGYINNKSLTNERFITLNKEKSILYYKTGDVVKEDEHGNLVYEGRIDGQVKVRGYRIELGEIEVVALKQEGVSQSAAMVREDIPGERKIVLYIVTEQQKNIGPAAAATRRIGC